MCIKNEEIYSSQSTKSFFTDEYTIQSNNAIFNPPYTHIIPTPSIPL